MRPVVEWLSVVVPDDYQSVCDALHDAKQNGTLAKIQAVRHYMCHRDKRTFWDSGRTSVLGTPETAARLHDAFDHLLRRAVQSTGEAPDAFCGEEYWYQVLKR